MTKESSRDLGAIRSRLIFESGPAKISTPTSIAHLKTSHHALCCFAFFGPVCAMQFSLGERWPARAWHSQMGFPATAAAPCPLASRSGSWQSAIIYQNYLRTIL